MKINVNIVKNTFGNLNLIGIYSIVDFSFISLYKRLSRVSIIEEYIHHPHVKVVELYHRYLLVDSTVHPCAVVMVVSVARLKL